MTGGPKGVPVAHASDGTPVPLRPDLRPDRDDWQRLCEIALLPHVWPGERAEADLLAARYHLTIRWRVESLGTAPVPEPKGLSIVERWWRKREVRDA